MGPYWKLVLLTPLVKPFTLFHCLFVCFQGLGQSHCQGFSTVHLLIFSRYKGIPQPSNLPPTQQGAGWSMGHMQRKVSALYKWVNIHVHATYICFLIILNPSYISCFIIIFPLTTLFSLYICFTFQTTKCYHMTFVNRNSQKGLACSKIIGFLIKLQSKYFTVIWMLGWSWRVCFKMVYSQ